LLKHPLQGSEGVPSTVAMMERQLGQMVHLVDDLLDVARISGGRLDLRKEWVDLGSLVRSAVESTMPLLEAGRYEFSVDLSDPSLRLEVDPTRISQVLSNLLDNAAKYTPAGGRIGLAACCDGAEVVISVADNGVGIAAESMPRIFEMFTQVGTSAQGGLGIGLSIVRRLSEMHGGSIEAESSGLGTGSTFTVRLPLGMGGAADPEALQPDAAPAAGAGRSLRLLVVDDNVDAAESLAALLKLSGHCVTVAADGFAALRLAAEFAPQVVFLDIGMPRMSGYEVAQALRRMPDGARFVIAAVTGWGSARDKATAKDAGFDYHLTKPVDLEAVEEILEAVSAGRSAVLMDEA
jgi:CheY-like chemotaxis protein